MRVLALAVVQPAAGGDSNTTVIVAVIGAVGLILAALITVGGSRSKDRFDNIERRFDAIEKAQAGLADALERLERRLEDGLARLGDRVDRLYLKASPPPTASEPTAEVRRAAAAGRTGHEEIPELAAELAEAMKRRGRAAGRKPSS